jgi:hypothetical protein
VASFVTSKQDFSADSGSNIKTSPKSNCKYAAFVSVSLKAGDNFLAA